MLGQDWILNTQGPMLLNLFHDPVTKFLPKHTIPAFQKTLFIIYTRWWVVKMRLIMPVEFCTSHVSFRYISLFFLSYMVVNFSQLRPYKCSYFVQTILNYVYIKISTIKVINNYNYATAAKEVLNEIL